MYPAPLTTKQLGILFFLVGIATVLLFFSIQTYKKTLYIDKKNNSTVATTKEIDIIPLSIHDPMQGNPKAPITIIGFEDFLCESCRVQHTLISELLNKYTNDVKFVWKDLPITTIPANSEMIHVYGYCMNKQNKFNEFKHVVFSNIITGVTPTLLDSIVTQVGGDLAKIQSCVNSEEPYTHLERNKQLARALQIQRTPTFFVQGKQVRTPNSLFEWETLLQQIQQ
jgi:protein-disulfide isomerase